MDNYVILKNQRPNPNFDAHIKGLLLNSTGDLITNPFNQGAYIKQDQEFFLKVNGNESMPGLYRDKLSVSIQNDEFLFVANDKLQRVLDAYCDNINYCKLNIQNSNTLSTDYKIVDILTIVDCIHHSKSRLIYWEMTHETVYNIDELELNEEVIPPNINIFLLGEFRGTVIVMHQRLKNAIQDQRITGFNFCQLKDFVI